MSAHTATRRPFAPAGTHRDGTHRNGARRDGAARDGAFRPLPLPLFPVQPLLAHIVNGVARRHPEMFNRLGPWQTRRFLIDLTDLPINLLLQPDPARPSLRAVRRGDPVRHDARIAGTFATLLALIDGRLDSDAIFFSRELKVSGDTEAVVALRNALDDMDLPLAEDICTGFGPLGRPLKRGLEVLRRMERRAS